MDGTLLFDDVTRRAFTVLLDPRAPFEERCAGAHILYSLAGAAHAPNERFVSDLFDAATRTLEERDLPDILVQAIGHLRDNVAHDAWAVDPSTAQAAQDPFLTPLVRLARAAHARGASLPLAFVVQQLDGLDPARVEVTWLTPALDALLAHDPLEAALFLEASLRGPEGRAAWVLRTLDEAPDLRTLGHLSQVRAFHAVAPDRSTWVRLAEHVLFVQKRRAPTEARNPLLAPATYGNRAGEAVRSLQEAVTWAAGKESVRLILAHWLSELAGAVDPGDDG